MTRARQLVWCSLLFCSELSAGQRITRMRTEIGYPENSPATTKISVEVADENNKKAEMTILESGVAMESPSSEAPDYIFRNEDNTLTGVNIKVDSKSRNVILVDVSGSSIVIVQNLAERLLPLLGSSGRRVNLIALEISSIKNSSVFLTADADGVPGKIDMNLEVQFSEEGQIIVAKARPAPP